MADSQDPGRLIAEAESATAGAAVDASADAAAVSSAPWSALTPSLVKVTCGVVLPQWEVPDGDQAEIAAAGGECLEQLFPGGIDGKYACWVRLIAACGAVTISAANRHGGKLPPLFARRASREPEPGAPMPANVDAPLQPPAAV